MVNNVGEVRVGPDSAGAQPGPACYGLGGTQPTITDLALLIGLLDPSSFGGGRLRLSVEAAEAAVRALDVDLDHSERIRAAWAVGLNNVVEGVFNVALQHGVDPRDYTLMAFGAAGGMLLPGVLEESHVAQVVVPPFPGHFSALGLLSGTPVYADSKTMYMPLDPSSADQIHAILNDLTVQLQARVPAEADAMSVSRAFDARLYGQSAATPFIEVPDGPITAESIPDLVERFHSEYELRHGNAFPDMPVEAVTFRVQIAVDGEKLRFPELAERSGPALSPRRSVTLRHLYPEPIDAPEYQRADLRAGDVVHGPAIVREPVSTTFVTPDQVLGVGRYGELVIKHSTESGGR